MELLNEEAAAYFGIMQIMLAGDLHLSIGRLTDPAKTPKNESLSLGQLLLKIDSATAPVGLRDKVAAKLAELDAECKGIRKRRHKVIAHYDLKTRLGRSATPLPTVDKKTLDAAFEKIREVMNVVNVGYTGAVTAFECDTDGDPQEVLYALKVSRKQKRQERIRMGVPPDLLKQSEV